MSSFDDIFRAFTRRPTAELIIFSAENPGGETATLINKILERLNEAIPEGWTKIPPVTQIDTAQGLNGTLVISTSPPGTKLPEKKSKPRTLQRRENSTVRSLEILRTLKGAVSPLSLDKLMEHLESKELAEASKRGTVVTQLSRMKGKGLITAEYEGFYDISAAGIKHLKNYASLYKHLSLGEDDEVND